MAVGNYSDTSTAERDLIRGQIGDTGPSPDFHLSDGELDQILGRIGGSGQSRFHRACALACRAIAARRAPAAFALQSAGSTFDREPVFDAWMKLAEYHEEEAKMAGSAQAVLLSHEDLDISDVEGMTGAKRWKRDDVAPTE